VSRPDVESAPAMPRDRHDGGTRRDVAKYGGTLASQSSADASASSSPGQAPMSVPQLRNQIEVHAGPPWRRSVSCDSNGRNIRRKDLLSTLFDNEETSSLVGLVVRIRARN